ncbi:hypothetical protein DXX98_10015 [Janibacter melonis]|nr:hypothetical protein [Janibacter melonis]
MSSRGRGCSCGGSETAPGAGGSRSSSSSTGASCASSSSPPIASPRSSPTRTACSRETLPWCAVCADRAGDRSRRVRWGGGPGRREKVRRGSRGMVVLSYLCPVLPVGAREPTCGGTLPPGAGGPVARHGPTCSAVSTGQGRRRSPR